jgi:hypothetical protein
MIVDIVESENIVCSASLDLMGFLPCFTVCFCDHNRTRTRHLDKTHVERNIHAGGDAVGHIERSRIHKRARCMRRRLRGDRVRAPAPCLANEANAYQDTASLTL